MLVLAVRVRRSLRRRACCRRRCLGHPGPGKTQARDAVGAGNRLRASDKGRSSCSVETVARPASELNHYLNDSEEQCCRRWPAWTGAGCIAGAEPALIRPSDSWPGKNTRSAATQRDSRIRVQCSGTAAAAYYHDQHLTNFRTESM